MADIRQWLAQVAMRGNLSAKSMEADFASSARDILDKAANGQIDSDSAVRMLRDLMRDYGLDTEGKAISDPASVARLRLVVDTNTALAKSEGMLAASAGQDIMFRPAWRYLRVSPRKEPRNWPKRWVQAGRSVAWKGASRREMVALKSSPIWAALGKGTGGYADTFGSSVPPFAYNSGMGWANCGRDEALRLRLIKKDGEERKQLRPSLSPRLHEIRELAKKYRMPISYFLPKPR